MKLLKNSNPKRILLVSMTNIGDVVLTCPVIDILKRDFPASLIDVVVGPKAVSLFEKNPNLHVKVFDKQAALKEKCKWFMDLYHQHYDCVIDLRHTMLSFFLMPKSATPLIDGRKPREHKKDVHLARFKRVYAYDSAQCDQSAIVTINEDEVFFEKEVSPYLQGQSFVVLAPGAADSAKRWDPQGFSVIADFISRKQKVVFVGDLNDVGLIKEIQASMQSSSLSLAGRINLRQLAFVLKKSSWALTHDSGVMHLASYFNTPLLVLWGPTNLSFYAPWSKKSIVIRKNERCNRCQNPKSKALHTCMSSIEVNDVMEAVRKIQA